ncbi:PREP1 [Symbiodinium sp. CCMP2592]|nr:PREP1 [Symbiodinium sp. CCMP2592]
MLPESRDLLEQEWDVCKPLWFCHAVDQLADRLKGALANQPDKAVGKQACFQRKVPLQAQDVPLFLHELFPEIGPLAEDLFAGEERLALAFLRLNKQDMDVLRGYMQMRRMDAGPLWSSISVGDMNFGRFMYVISGRMFVVMLPFDAFEKAVREDGETLGQVAATMGNYSIHDVIELGGSYVLLDQGEGCHCPPGYLTFQCNWLYMHSDDPDDAPKVCESSFSVKLSYLSIITLPQGLFRNEPALQLARRWMELSRDSAKTSDQVKFRQMGDAGLELVGYLLPAVEPDVKPEPGGSPVLQQLARDAMAVDGAATLAVATVDPEGGSGSSSDAASGEEGGVPPPSKELMLERPGADAEAAAHATAPAQEEISGAKESKHAAADATAQESSGVNAEPKHSAAESKAQERSGGLHAEPKHSSAGPDADIQAADADDRLWGQLETQLMGPTPKVRIDYDDVPVDLHGFLAQDEADVEYELGRAKAHPYFQEHISYIKTELGVDDDYEFLGTEPFFQELKVLVSWFGSDDCIADLEHWFQWLQGKKTGKNQREESLMPLIPVPKPTSNSHVTPSEPDEATKALDQLKKMQESSRKRAEEAAAKGRAKAKATARQPKTPKTRATPKAKGKTKPLKK